MTTTLDDAKAYAQHAAKKTIDTEDIQLAVNMQLDKSFTTPPPRDVSLDFKKTTPNINSLFSAINGNGKDQKFCPITCY